MLRSVCNISLSSCSVPCGSGPHPHCATNSERQPLSGRPCIKAAPPAAMPTGGALPPPATAGPLEPSKATRLGSVAVLPEALACAGQLPQVPTPLHACCAAPMPLWASALVEALAHAARQPAHAAPAAPPPPPLAPAPPGTPLATAPPAAPPTLAPAARSGCLELRASDASSPSTPPSRARFRAADPASPLLPSPLAAPPLLLLLPPAPASPPHAATLHTPPNAPPPAAAPMPPHALPHASRPSQSSLLCDAPPGGAPNACSRCRSGLCGTRIVTVHERIVCSLPFGRPATCGGIESRNHSHCSASVGV
mmetsp:Transcript_33724/g.92450  ORF Transcript_33724/g.92450 Transcript_33724/m.92450 type:complete len:309 (+) Transcript_33724:243-1169(+)